MSPVLNTITKPYTSTKPSQERAVQSLAPLVETPPLHSAGHCNLPIRRCENDSIQCVLREGKRERLESDGGRDTRLFSITMSKLSHFEFLSLAQEASCFMVHSFQLSLILLPFVFPYLLISN